jgi:HAE1 family hydrophobic/amphiphilic exporter-1
VAAPPEFRDNPVVRTALRRPITMLAVLATAIVIGIVALINTPVELIPSGFSPPFMHIDVPYPNATPQDIEDKITRPLEQGVSTTPGLDTLRSRSHSAGADLTLIFEEDVDMDIAYREVRDRVARTRPDLPDDVERVRIHKESGAGIPVAFYVITWPDSLDNAQDLIERHIVRAVERIEGVALVNLWGEEDREIRIEIDRALAEAANLNIVSIADRLSRSNFQLPSGSIQEPSGKLMVRSLATYQTIEQLENTIITAQGLRLKDVAEVVYARPESDRRDRYNGKRSSVLFVMKESQANTVEVCDKVKAAIDDVAESPTLQSFEIEPIFLQGDMIRFSLGQVTDAGMQGGGLAFFILLFFLRRLRLTLMIALAIPLSLFMSLPVMYFTGQSVNLVSLLGLMICIGLVVDNSVVVAENIQRYRERGVGRFAAALHGAGEVALAITLATLTTMVVFAPAALLSSGPTQFFMIRMVTPICVALLTSLFVALILIPLASAFLIRGAGSRDPQRRRKGLVGRIQAIDSLWKQWLTRAYAATLGRLNVLYGRLLRTSLRRRIDTVVVCMLVLGSIYIPMEEVGCVAQGNMGGRQVSVYYSMPAHTSLEEADEFFAEIEELLDERKEEYRLHGQHIGYDSAFGEVNMWFEPPEPGEPSFRERGKEIFEELPVRPGWHKRSRFADSDGAREMAFQISLYGDDHETVQRVQEELETMLVQQPGVIGVENRGQDSRRRDELALSIDRSLAQYLGVASGMVANTVRYAIGGSRLPRFRTEDREIDVSIRYRKADREQLDQLLKFKVPTAVGDTIPIQVLADQNVRRGQTSLRRADKRVAAAIRLDLVPEQREETVMRLRKVVRDYRLPDGMSFDADKEARRVRSSEEDLLGSMALSVVFIFLLMGFLFESFVLPLSVLPAIPLSFVGVYWFLYLTGSKIDPLAGIGVLLLLGVVVNNAIVLVDFINNARRHGLPRTEAIVQAGQQRFRPILMTALTTVAGMLPLAFSEQTGEGIPYGPFGKTLVGGMTTATVLTLVVVPVAYTLFDDLRGVAWTWTERLLRRR